MWYCEATEQCISKQQQLLGCSCHSTIDKLIRTQWTSIVTVYYLDSVSNNNMVSAFHIPQDDTKLEGHLIKQMRDVTSGWLPCYERVNSIMTHGILQPDRESPQDREADGKRPV